MPIVRPFAERNGLKIDWNNPAATVSKLAVITQTPKEFDFPIAHLPAQFRYAGPLHDDKGRQSVPFPWEKLDGRPLIYASMGTLVNGLRNVYGTILEAASEFPEMQMVLSVGSNSNPALCITHAGLNTALEALAQGVPMVAIPVGYDQPGVAARIAYHGVGDFIEIGNLTPRRLTELIAKIKGNPNYRDKAAWFQKSWKRTMDSKWPPT